jgi:hypothetical protein
MGSCLVRQFGKLFGKGGAESKSFESIDDLFNAFSHGLIPNLEDPSQRKAFELYRVMRLGNPATELKPDTTSTIAKILHKHPELEKISFRDFQLRTQKRHYPVTKELKAFLDSQVTSAGQVRSNLFQIDANSGFWKKVLQYDEPEGPKLNSLARDASDEQKQAYRQLMKQAKEKAQAQWVEFLNERLTPQVRKRLSDPNISSEDRASELFQVLRSERERLKAQKKDIKPISQAMVDIVHTIGYPEPSISQALKSSDGMERILAYRRVLDFRDRFAMKLGFRDHFDQVLREFGEPAGVTMPTGVPAIHGMTEMLRTLERAVESSSSIIDAAVSSRTVRHLSIVESPYRSCLGGSDCSSRTYLTRALDPNYHYFTITDESGHSSGHITIVLGDAKLNDHDIRAAFIDKVQNVPHTDLPAMVEAIRRSVEEKGYRLILPNEMGDGNGISNEALTRAFVKESIKTESAAPVLGFQPHPHDYRFKNKYSRAELSLESHIVTPFESFNDVLIEPGDISSAWKTSRFDKSLDINKIVRASYRLKDSASLEDRIKYIGAMKSVREGKLRVDPLFEMTLRRWISNPNEPFSLRKEAAVALWLDCSKDLSQVMSGFNNADRAQFLQNILDTPRHRDRIFKFGDADLLLAIGRESKAVREALIPRVTLHFRESMQPFIEKVLDASDISDSLATEVLKALRRAVLNFDVDSWISTEKMLRGTSLEKTFSDQLSPILLSAVATEPTFVHGLTRCFSVSDPDFHALGVRMLEAPRMQSGRVGRAYRGYVELQNEGRALPNDPRTEDALKRIAALRAIRSVDEKAQFHKWDAVLYGWMEDPKQTMNLRKQALLYQWIENAKKPSSLLSVFKQDEQIHLMDEFLRTPRLRSLILENRYERVRDVAGVMTEVHSEENLRKLLKLVDEDLSDLILKARHRPELRNSLIHASLRDEQEQAFSMIERILNASEISDQLARQLIRSTRASVNSFETLQIVEFQKLVRNVDRGTEFTEKLMRASVAAVKDDLSFVEGLFKCLDSSGALDRSTGQHLLDVAKEQGKFSDAEKGFRELLALQRSGLSSRSLERTMRSWLRSEEGDPLAKARLLLPSFLNPKLEFGLYRDLLPESQRSAIFEEFSRILTDDRFYKALHEYKRNDSTEVIARMLFGTVVVGFPSAVYSSWFKDSTGCYPWSNGINPIDTEMGREVDDSEYWKRRDPQTCRSLVEKFCLKYRVSRHDKNYCDKIENLVAVKALSVLMENGVSIDREMLGFSSKIKTRSQMSCLKGLSRDQLQSLNFKKDHSGYCN